MHKQFQARQGDVFVERVGEVDELPEGLEPIKRDQGRIVLAYGEVTGHSHAIADRNAEMFSKPGTSDRWLVIRASGTTVESGATLRHEEHSAITLEPGVYRVVTQREYSPEQIRNVAD